MDKKHESVEKDETTIIDHSVHKEEKKDILPTPIEEGMQKKEKVISTKIAVIIAGVIILGAIAFYCKGWVIAATVNGSLVSRSAVLSELEKTSGKQVLDAIITKKLITGEAAKKGVTLTNDELAAEIKKIEDQVKAQGGTLDVVLLQQNMTRKDMEEQVRLQKELEKLLGDKVMVTDEEAVKFLADSKVVVPKGEEEKYKQQAIDQLRTEKLNASAGAYIESLRAQASIKRFVNY